MLLGAAEQARRSQWDNLWCVGSEGKICTAMCMFGVGLGSGVCQAGECEVMCAD